MHKLILYFFILITFCKCTTPVNEISKENIFETILNQNFLAIADTLAYKYYTLIPAPNEEKKPIKSKGEYIICVADSIGDVKKAISLMETTSIYNSLSENFQTLLKEYDKKLLTNLNINKIKNTGLYSLNPPKSCNEKNPDIVGQLQFYQLVADTKNAILFVTISDKIKSGRTCAYLLTNEKEKWAIQQKFTLEVW